MTYGRKNVCLNPFYPTAKFEQNRSTFLPRHGPTRHGRHAFEAPITRNLCVLEEDFLIQKMIICFIKLMYQNLVFIDPMVFRVDHYL